MCRKANIENQSASKNYIYFITNASSVNVYKNFIIFFLTVGLKLTPHFFFQFFNLHLFIILKHFKKIY